MIIIDTAKVIFKLRCITPNLPSTPNRNMNHIRYIGTREGVTLNISADNGLFGKVQDMDSMGEIKSVNRVREYVLKKSQEKTNMYRGIISLNEIDAIKLGYDKKEKWEMLMLSKINDIAETMGIKAQNVEWLGAVHMEKGHPHLHIAFWDKAQEVKNPFIHPQKANKIRTDLIKHIYNEELQELYDVKTQARDLTRKGEYLEDIEKVTNELIAKDSRYSKGKIIYNKLSNERILEISRDIVNLKEKLPKRGRLNYKLLPREVKYFVDAITFKILENSKDCKREFENYIQASVSISKMYSSKDSKYVEDKAIKEMINIIGNKVLEIIKDINVSQIRKSQINNIFFEIFNILSRETNTKQAQLKQLQTGDLSKQAKLEFAKQKEHKGLEW